MEEEYNGAFWDYVLSPEYEYVPTVGTLPKTSNTKSAQAERRHAASLQAAQRNELAMAERHAVGNCLSRCVPCRLDRETEAFRATLGNV